MASVKIASLFIKTVSKPIASKLKQQAQEHESFRRICIGLAQTMHRSEVKLRTGLLNEPKASIRPLNDAKAVTNGATALAEGFLLLVGVSLIAGEAYRSSRSASRRRDDVDDRLDELGVRVDELKKMFEKSLKGDEEDEGVEGRLDGVDDRMDHLASTVDQIIRVGMRGGFIPLTSSSSNTSSPSISASSTTHIASNPPPSSLPSTSPIDPPLPTSTLIEPFVRLNREQSSRSSAFAPFPSSSSSSSKKSKSLPPPVEKRVDEGYVEEMIDGRVHLDSEQDTAD